VPYLNGDSFRFSPGRKKKMARKVMFFLLAIVVVLAGFVNVAQAAQNVANTNKKGSLLIFPFVSSWVVEFGEQQTTVTDTFFRIGNDYFQDVWVQCYWVDENQTIADFMFRLTPNQPIMFSASTGTSQGYYAVNVPPFAPFNVPTSGELKCWAVNNAGDQQISFNHLYGSAMVVTYAFVADTPAAFEYNAWSFASQKPFGSTVGTGGAINLNGIDYDRCPAYLVENFSPAAGTPTPSTPLPASSVGPVLALAPCQQDLQQDRTPTCTKAKFDVWNADETKFGGAYKCVKCWSETLLASLAAPLGFGGDTFSMYSLKTHVARFRVYGVRSSVCNGKFISRGGKTDLCTGGQVASPFVGVMFEEMFFIAPNPGSRPINLMGTTPHSAGADSSGFVLWDPAGPTPEAKKR
jgi:hypothetical protein